MKFNISTILFTVINFIILMCILRHFFWDKIKAAVAERENYIEDKIIKADEDAEKARKFRIENERILKSAKEEGNKITETKKQKADNIYKEIVEDAHKEATSIMDRAKREIDREKQKAEFELRAQSVDLAILLSSKALEESIDEDKHRALINDFISKVGV